MQPNQPLNAIQQLRGIVTHAIFEDNPHVIDI